MLVVIALIAFAFGMDQLRVGYVVAMWDTEVARVRELFIEGHVAEAYKSKLWSGYERAFAENNDGIDKIINIRSYLGCRIETHIAESPTLQLEAIYYPYPWSNKPLTR